MRNRFLILLGVTGMLAAQGTWTWNMRTHSELDWYTIETEHFSIHYHNGLEKIAEKGAIIAEQIYQPVMDQLEMKDFGKTDMVFTAEDEIVNGYAMPTNMIFIWVYQNDASGWFLGSEKWLYQVIAHEFQHIVLMNGVKTWLGIWNLMTLPGWFTEGTAEFYTELWRVGRSDARMKIHTYKNTMKELDSHDQGYAKVLYMAEKYGDSTITKIVHHRDKFKIGKWEFLTRPYSFKKAFKKHTGQSVKDFEEEWRRAMNTYYYSYKGQKEGVDEVGEVIPVKGLNRGWSFAVSPDSSLIAVVGRKERDQRDQGLYTITLDTNRTVTEIHYGSFGSQPSWSPNGQSIAIGEYHRGAHGSLTWDIRKIDVKANRFGQTKRQWLTRNLRANHPDFSPDGERIVFVSHPEETTNLYTVGPDGTGLQQITHFEGDVQVNHPKWSPDGDKIAFMIQDETGDVDIAIVDADGSNFRKLTHDREEDVLPIWSASGKEIIFTSFRNSTPNLFRASVERGSVKITQVTDVAEGIYSTQRIPNSNDLLATTLADVDTTRIVSLDWDRQTKPLALNIRSRYSSWRSEPPTIKLQPVDYAKRPAISGPHRYHFWNHPKLFGSLIFPVYSKETGLSLTGFTFLTDALGKQLLVLGGDFGFNGRMNGLYVGYVSAALRPIVSLGYFRKSYLGFMLYDGTPLTEWLDGYSISMDFPFNFGNRLTSNHQVGLSLRMWKRGIAEFDSLSIEGNLPLPVEGREGIVNLHYRWLSRRPHKVNSVLPRNGFGVSADYDMANESVWGEFDYTRFAVQGFANIHLKGPVVLFSRLKYLGQDGSPPVQSYVGLSNDPGIYFPPDAISGMVISGFVNIPETHKLRGYSKVRLGDRLLVGTNELRFPILSKLPVNVFGISLGRITGALFHDFGLVFAHDDESRVEVQTAGFELRNEIKLGKSTLLITAYGVGNTLPGWRNDTDPEEYLRLALVNPF